MLALTITALEDFEPSKPKTLKVYEVLLFKLIKVYEVLFAETVLVILLDPAAATTLIAVTFPLANAAQESFAVLVVVTTVTLLALGTTVAALALMPTALKESVASRNAEITLLFNFKICLTSNGLVCHSHQGLSSGCNQPA